MKITEFNNEYAKEQKGKKGHRVNSGDIAEQTRSMRRRIKEGTGVDIYVLIRRL